MLVLELKGLGSQALHLLIQLSGRIIQGSALPSQWHENEVARRIKKSWPTACASCTASHLFSQADPITTNAFWTVALKLAITCHLKASNTDGASLALGTSVVRKLFLDYI